MPQAILFAFIGSFLNYWVSKYMLLRQHKMPDMFSDFMANFFSNFMPWIILVWACTFRIFLSMIFRHYNLATESLIDTSDIKESLSDAADAVKNLDTDDIKEMFDGVANSVPLVAVFIAVIFILLPVRTLLNCCVDEHAALEDESEYKTLALTFSTDYDKENPLTIKKG